MTASSLAFGVVGAFAAGSATVTKVTCKTATGVSVSQGDTAVTPPALMRMRYRPGRVRREKSSL